MKKVIFSALLFNVLMAQAQVTSGLVAHYNFDADANDSKGGVTGKAYNCIYVDDRNGKPASAISILGLSNSFANLGSAASLKPTSGAISMWVNVNLICDIGKGFDYNPILLAKNNASKSSLFEGYCFYIKRSDKKFLTITTRESNGAERYIFSKSAATLNNWHHLVMNYNYDSLWFYVDNDLQGRVSRTFDQVFAAGDSVLLGASKVSSNDRYFNGSVDDLRIYNKILSSKQVDSLYRISSLSDKNIIPLNTENVFLVYPNPSTGVVYFNSSLEISSFELMDITGKLIMTGSTKNELDLSYLKGMYIMRCTNKQGLLRTEKILLD